MTVWIDRKTYDDLRLNVAKRDAECQVLQQQNTTLTVTLDWLRVRVTQLEMERAQMLWRYTGVKVPVPEIVKTDGVASNPMTQTPNFNDVGNAEAAKLGISWDANGELIYSDTK